MKFSLAALPIPGNPLSFDTTAFLHVPQVAAQMCQKITAAQAILSLTPRFSDFRQLGGGVQGFVFSARDQRIALDVAIKCTLVQDGQEEVPGFGNVRERFQREFDILLDLNHRDLLVRPFEFGEVRICEGASLCPNPATTMLWYTMELCDISLKSALPPLGSGEAPRVPLEDRIAIALQVLDAIAMLHAHSLAHRDIKLENVFLPRRSRPDARVRLGDLGIARSVRRGGLHAARLTDSDTQLGTLHYMAPECFSPRLASELDLLAVDQYAAGMITWEILSHGRTPFDFGDQSQVAILRAKIQQEPLALQVPEIRGAVPKVDRVLGQMMARDPAERFGARMSGAGGLLQAIAALRSAMRLSGWPVPG